MKLRLKICVYTPSFICGNSIKLGYNTQFCKWIRMLELWIDTE